MLKKQMQTVIETMSLDLDEANALIEELESQLSRQTELVKSLNAEADDLSLRLDASEEAMKAVRRENSSLVANDKIQRETIVKQADRLSELGANPGGEDLGVAADFLQKARSNPLRVGMKLLFTPVRTGIVKQHGRAEPQAWTTQRLFSELCVSSFRQRKWNEQQLATTRAKLRDMGVDPETGEALDTTTEVPASRIQFFDERVAWESDVLDYWSRFHQTACNIYSEATGEEWSPPAWLTKEKESKPVSSERASGRDVIDEEKRGQQADVVDLI